MQTLDGCRVSSELARRLQHVRWIAGGTGAGKSTVAHVLAQRFEVRVLDGDRAQHSWIARCSPHRHPRWHALATSTPEQRAARSPEQTVAAMPSMNGESMGFLVEDLLALPDDRPVLVDWFGVAPAELAPLLTWREQAVFLLPTAEFRLQTLGARYADPARARANWGDVDHARAFERRLARDELVDAEWRRQAEAADLPIRTVDGTVSVGDLADTLARDFRLRP